MISSQALSAQHSIIILLLIIIINFIVFSCLLISHTLYHYLVSHFFLNPRVGCELQDSYPLISILYNGYFEIHLCPRQQTAVINSNVLIKKGLSILFVAILRSFHWICIQKLWVYKASLWRKQWQPWSEIATPVFCLCMEV